MTDVREFEKLKRRVAELDRLENGLGGGSAFPASPSTGALFYRTDIDFLCFYDGTRWLTVHEYEAGLEVVTTTSSPVSASYVANRTDYAPYVTRTTMATNVAATNDGSNYWTVNIRGINGAFSAGTTVIGRNTSADTAAVWAYVETSGGSLTSQTPANYAYWEIQATKTAGTPGALTVTVLVVFRLIIT